MQHRVAQPGAFGHAQGGPAGGHDAAFHLELRKTAVVCGHNDIGGQHQLNAQGVGDALHGYHHGFGAAPITRRGQIGGLDQTQRNGFFTSAHHRRERRQIEPRREVRTCRMQHAHPQGRVFIESGVGLRQFAEHFGRKAVAFGRAIDTNQQQVALHHHLDATRGGGVQHGIRIRRGRRIRVNHGIH